MLNGTLGRDPLPSLVVTFGLSIVIQNLLLELFSADPRSIETEGLNTRSLELPGGLAVGVLPVLIFAVAVAATAALQWLFARTQLGRAFRAVSDDREIAELMGLDARKVYALATAIAFVLIALAGVLQGMRTTVSPSDGPLLLLFAFEAVIIGGMGSFWGTFVGALLLGITQQIGFRIDPGWGLWAGHVRVPRGAAGAAAGAVPEDARMSGMRIEVVRSTRASRGAARVAGVLVVCSRRRCRSGHRPNTRPRGCASSSRSRVISSSR